MSPPNGIVAAEARQGQRYSPPEVRLLVRFSPVGRRDARRGLRVGMSSSAAADTPPGIAVPATPSRMGRPAQSGISPKLFSHSPQTAPTPVAAKTSSDLGVLGLKRVVLYLCLGARSPIAFR